MKKSFNQFAWLIPAALLLLTSCSKSLVAPADETSAKNNDIEVRKGKPVKPPTTSSYTTYTIQQGAHYCDQSTIKSVQTAEMKFAVKFDVSAEYTTVIANNQYDINKLYGFSEGFDNQYNSARIGWNWYDNALHLHAYVYSKGVRAYKEIKTVAIGSDIQCSIKVSGSSYVFTVDGVQVNMPRGVSTSSASGYQQYPYFGGDETAPHKITILIQNL